MTRYRVRNRCCVAKALDRPAPLCARQHILMIKIFRVSRKSRTRQGMAPGAQAGGGGPCIISLACAREANASGDYASENIVRQVMRDRRLQPPLDFVPCGAMMGVLPPQRIVASIGPEPSPQTRLEKPFPAPKRRDGLRQARSRRRAGNGARSRRLRTRIGSARRRDAKGVRHTLQNPHNRSGGYRSHLVSWACVPRRDRQSDKTYVGSGDRSHRPLGGYRLCATSKRSQRQTTRTGERAP